MSGALDDAESKTFAVFSNGLWKIRHLSRFLGGARLLYRPDDAALAHVDGVLCWGNKSTSQVAVAHAERHGKSLLRLEDGFFRSLRSGPEHPPLSLVFDDVGIYYDAGRPSRLELCLNGNTDTGALSDRRLLTRAESAIERVRSSRLSKYNDSDPRSLGMPQVDDFVLVVDQTRGDASVECGLTPEGGFDAMLQAALDENPGVPVVVKVHPDVLAGRKKGYLTRPRRDTRITLLGAHVNPIELLERARRVYTCTSQLGFEALVLGKPVSCFGVPFYAGWGLTDDRVACTRRTERRTLVELAAAAWIFYPRYVHPVRGESTQLEDILDHLALQRRTWAQNAGTSRAYCFSAWKRPFIEKYLQSSGAHVEFVRKPSRQAPPSSPNRVVVWGQRVPPGLEQDTERARVPFVRVEDGFLRSVGLGSDLVAPRSLVFDEHGLYYDPSRPSDLEILLQNSAFTDAQRARAARLREEIVRLGLSKYNFSTDVPLALPETRSRPVLLVPGQVTDDASVQLGGGAIASDAALIDAVRKARPEAFLLYKPHPDVVSGNRAGGLSTEQLALVDHVETRASLSACLAAASEVHTLTSLVGFEALLRHLSVTTYGRPFYAGWGLTTDRESLPRRTRRLQLDELVHGVLIDYPRYYSYEADCFVEPEDTLFELAHARAQGADLAPRASSFARRWSRLRGLWKGVLLGR